MPETVVAGVGNKFLKVNIVADYSVKRGFRKISLLGSKMIYERIMLVWIYETQNG